MKKIHILPMIVTAWTLLFTSCSSKTALHQATAALQVTADEAIREQPATNVVSWAKFCTDQLALLRSPSFEARVLSRLNQEPQHAGQKLHNLRLEMKDGGIIEIAARSTSAEFARSYISHLVDEYLRFRGEQQALRKEERLLEITQEINRLAQELKASLTPKDQKRVSDLYESKLNELNKREAMTYGDGYRIDVLDLPGANSGETEPLVRP